MKTENLPSGWSREPLASLARDITSGATPESGSPRYYTEAGGIRFAKIDDLTAASNRQLHGTFLHITPVALRETALSLYPAGTILLSMYGTVGLVKTTSCEMCANQALSALLPPFSCDPDYLAHALIWSRPRWDRYKAQTTQANINGRTVKQFECDLPPLREQRRIAEILDTLDEAIRKTEQVIAKLQQMKRGLLHDLLTRGIDENGELRDPERHPEQFKDSELGRIPRGWEVLRVGSALESIEQGWSPDCDTEAARKDQWGVLKTTSVTWAGYEDSASKSLPQHLPPRPEYEVRCEDVLMTRAGPNSRVGVVALVSATQGKLMLSDKLYRLSPKTKKLTPAFLALALSGEQTQRHLSTLKTGLAESQTNISQAIVRSLWIATPDLSEQERINATHAELTRQAQTVNFNLAKLRSLKEGLMDDLLTGRVRVAICGEDQKA